MTGKFTLLRNPPHKGRMGILGLWILADGYIIDINILRKKKNIFLALPSLISK